jgi:hypothetical protein
VGAIESNYGRCAIPFQTLNFARATQQALHADSVHFDSIPSGWMCGVWVALEDVGPDQGPLRVVPGSHRVTHEAFAEVAAPRGPFDMCRYEQLLEERLAGFPVEEFHASTGDALMWHAHLAHGGALLRSPGTTRWSQVTHYFFEGCTYTTPILGDAGTGEIRLREPLIDIATRRTVDHQLDGRRARIIRTGSGRAVLLRARDQQARFPVRAVSAVRGLSRRSSRRASWFVSGLRIAVVQRVQSATAVASPRANRRYPSSSR